MKLNFSLFAVLSVPHIEVPNSNQRRTIIAWTKRPRLVRIDPWCFMLSWPSHTHSWEQQGRLCTQRNERFVKLEYIAGLVGYRAFRLGQISNRFDYIQLDTNCQLWVVGLVLFYNVQYDVSVLRGCALHKRDCITFYIKNNDVILFLAETTSQVKFIFSIAE